MGVADIVNANSPVLLLMAIMDKESLTPCTLSNQLAKRARCTTEDRKQLSSINDISLFYVLRAITCKQNCLFPTKFC